MYMADALRMVYLLVNICDRMPFVENIDATMFLPGTAERLQPIRHATSDDPVLSEMIQACWIGEKRGECAAHCTVILGSS